MYELPSVLDLPRKKHEYKPERQLTTIPHNQQTKKQTKKLPRLTHLGPPQAYRRCAHLVTTKCNPVFLFQGTLLYGLGSL